MCIKQFVRVANHITQLGIDGDMGGYIGARLQKKLSVEELELVEKKLEDYNLSRLNKDI